MKLIIPEYPKLDIDEKLDSLSYIAKCLSWLCWVGWYIDEEDRFECVNH